MSSLWRAVAALGLIGAVVAAVALIVAYVQGDRNPLVTLDLKAEYVVQKVSRSALASVPLVAATVRSEITCEGATSSARGVTGVLRPPQDAILTYRWSPERIAITVDTPPAGSGVTQLTYFDAQGEERDCALPASARFVLERSDGSATWRPLPIAGSTQVGVEFGVPVAPQPDGSARTYNLSRGGEVRVFGRAALGPDRGAIFPVSDGPLVIAAGSRVASSADVTGPGPADAWYGLAFVEDDGLRISATTETARLLIYRPGAGEGQFEYLSFGLFTWVVNDPSLAWLSFVLLVFVLTAQTAAAINVLSTRSAR